MVVVCLFSKSLLSFSTFMNFESAYLLEGFFHNLCSYFDFVFAGIRNTFVEIVAVRERYL